MKFNINIKRKIPHSSRITDDHCLVILPTTKGPDEFTSITSIGELYDNFGTTYLSPFVGIDDDTYSNIVRNSLKVILNSGLPLLVRTAVDSIKATLRLYESDGKIIPCSISHNKEFPFSSKKMITNITKFVKGDHIVTGSSHKTLVHSIPLNIVEDEEGVELSISEKGDDYRGWFITLPVQRIENDKLKEEIPPYILFINNQDKVLTNELYSTTSPILTEAGDVVELDCNGTKEQVESSVTKVNNYLKIRYDKECSDNPTINNYVVLLDWKKRKIYIVSDQFVVPSSSYSLPYGDFLPDQNASGWIADEITKESAVLDVISRYSGDLGNYSELEFTKSNDSSIVRYLETDKVLDEFRLYPNTIVLDENHYFDCIQYNHPSKSILNIEGKFKLTGGINETEVREVNILDKYKEFFSLDDSIPIRFIFDIGVNSYAITSEVCTSIKTSSNTNTLFLGRSLGYINPIIEKEDWNSIFYMDRPLEYTKYNLVLLGAEIISSLYRADFTSSINYLLTPGLLHYLDKKVKYVTYPDRIKNSLVLLDIALPGKSYEETIDILILGALNNRLEEHLPYIMKDLDLTNESKSSMYLTNFIRSLEIYPSLLVDVKAKVSGRGPTVKIDTLLLRKELIGGMRDLNITINI